MITGINHITLTTKDLEKSFAFYRDVLGLKPLCRWVKGAYFLAGEQWFCLNIDINCSPAQDYTHYAFNVTDENFSQLEKKIIDSGAEIFQENKSPGKSLYFLDPDGHKLEIHVGSWQDRIATLQAENKNMEFFT